MKTFEEFLEESSAPKTEKEYEYTPAKTQNKNSLGHTVVGQTWMGKAKTKGANILKHKDTGKYFASGGSSTSITKSTTFHDSPEAAAKSYHNKQ